MTPHQNYLAGTVLKRGHNICFHGGMKKKMRIASNITLSGPLLCPSWDLPHKLTSLTLKAPIMTAADDIHKYIFIVLQRK